MPAEPLRVVVLGNSTGLEVCTANPEPASGPYPLQLGRELTARGRPAVVTNRSRWMATVSHGVGEWQEQVWTAWPDLVVLTYGFNEILSAALPRFLHRVAWDIDRTDGRIDDRVRRITQRHWPTLRAVTGRFDVEGVPGHMSMHRFRRQIERVVDQTIRWTPAKVVLVGPQPPSRRLLKLGGGYPSRQRRLQSVLEEVAADRERCGFVDMAVAVASAGGVDVALPDGMHLTPAGHSHLASAIADCFELLEGRELPPRRRG